MKLLRVYFDHLRMFEDGKFEIDLFATDRVPSTDESASELSRPIYSNNILALAGINASGKTTALNLIELACRIVSGSPINGGWLPASVTSLFDGCPTFRCLLWNDGGLYFLESTLVTEVGPAENGEYGLGFADETVWRVPLPAVRKSTLSLSWDELKEGARSLYQRTELDPAYEILASTDVSIARLVISREQGRPSRLTVVRERGFELRQATQGLDDILRVFDSRIDHLEVLDSGRAFSLKFFDEEPMLLSREGLDEVLSSGTIRGIALVMRAITALRDGGYLLVDEIENHLNRQLVNVVVDLFAASATNPRAATIVFTTHYPQLLDHIHRKDNVFFLVRGESRKSQVIKYSDRVKRIENKKSEVFVSNYVKGTAPRFTDVRALRSHVVDVVAHG